VPPKMMRGEDIQLSGHVRVDGLKVFAVGSKDRGIVGDVSFEVPAGSSIGMVGESGSGKSITARAIVGLLPKLVRAEGSICIDGRELLGASERQLRTIRGSRIALLMQDPFTMLNPVQTVHKHISESLDPSVRRSRSQVHTEVERRLAEVGLDADVARRFPFQLSGGMRQRVALAAALAQDPELLIADEPTTALDVSTQNEVLTLLRELQKSRGMSLLMITHNLQVAFAVCDRILVMYGGALLEDGPAAALIGAPQHPYSLGLQLADPSVSHYQEKLMSIPGSVPQPDDVSDECAFASRCRWQAPECTVARPSPVWVAPDHRTACIRIDEIQGELAALRNDLERAVDPPEPNRGEVLLSVEDLWKSYRTSHLLRGATTSVAVRGVSFELFRGESVGLVGESGSGKTTIARSILGLVTPDSGSIRVDGRNITDYKRLKRAERRQAHKLVQVVFQDPYSSLNPALRIGATLREALSLRGTVSDYDAEIGALLVQVGLPAGYAARYPSDLSGGERQRAAIARALAVQPELLICDEPVAALDVSVQAQILELLRKIRREYDMSILLITHDLAVVRQMTDRVLVLYKGEMVERGATGAVLDHPAHPYTARLVAAVPGD